MVADQRADALVENFVGQWLQLRNLDSRARPDLLLFPDFDGNLRNAFRTETEMLFAHVLREGRPVNELMTADYTFVNERLARHYGFPGVYGSRFRKVPVDGPESPRAVRPWQHPVDHRRLIAHVADHPRQVHRHHVLEQPAASSRRRTSRRSRRAPRRAGRRPCARQLELHRANPTCAACHNNIDPVGFALENFDVDGSWRDYHPRRPEDRLGRHAGGRHGRRRSGRSCVKLCWRNRRCSPIL